MPDFQTRTEPTLEDNPELVERLDDLLGPDEGALAMIAPYIPEQISPTRSEFAQIGYVEELKIERAIDELKDSGVTNLHLLLNSLGGGVSSSFKVARALRRNFEEISVYIPHQAVSGGTLVALIGDKIVMGEMSHISPIDPQILRENRRHSVNSLPRIFGTLETFFSDTAVEDAPYPWKALADKLDPIEMQEHIDSASMMVEHAKQILNYHDDLSEQDVEGVIHKLTSEYPTHTYAITYTEAKDIFGERLLHSSESDLMDIMDEWLHTYIGDGSNDHHVRYVPAFESPEDETDNGTETVETESGERA